MLQECTDGLVSHRNPCPTPYAALSFSQGAATATTAAASFTVAVAITTTNLGPGPCPAPTWEFHSTQDCPQLRPRALGIQANAQGTHFPHA